MQERIAIALERIAKCLETMHAEQTRQMKEMREQSSPDKIAEVTQQISKMLAGGMKHGN